MPSDEIGTPVEAQLTTYYLYSKYYYSKWYSYLTQKHAIYKH